MTIPILSSFPPTKFAKYCIAILLVALTIESPAFPSKTVDRLKVVKAASVAVSAQKLAAIDVEVERDIKQHHLPGAVVLVARNGGVVWRKAYGARTLEPAREAMTVETVFDVASLTKVIATTTSIMILIERGEVRLSDPLSNYIPEIKGEEKNASRSSCC